MKTECRKSCGFCPSSSNTTTPSVVVQKGVTVPTSVAAVETSPAPPEGSCVHTVGQGGNKGCKPQSFEYNLFHKRFQLGLSALRSLCRWYGFSLQNEVLKVPIRQLNRHQKIKRAHSCTLTNWTSKLTPNHASWNVRVHVCLWTLTACGDYQVHKCVPWADKYGYCVGKYQVSIQKHPKWHVT